MARTSQSSTSALQFSRPPVPRADPLTDPLADPLGASGGGPVGASGGSSSLVEMLGGPLQFKRKSGPVGGEHEAASKGLSGGGGELPHRDRIESSFGVDLGGVQAHTGASAASACDGLGAEGFTMGNQVAFASSSPSLGLAAHEAAHVVQQADGVHLSSKVGQVGDSYEAQADAAAARVVAGQSAADILPSSGGGSSMSGAVQFKRESKDYDGTSSDNGRIYLSGEQSLYADPALIDEANRKLENVGKDGSFITLAYTGDRYKHEGHDLAEVTPKWVDHDDMGDHQGASDANENGVEDSNGITSEASGTMALWADCGRASGAVTGSVMQNHSDRQAVYKKGGKEKLTGGQLEEGMNPTGRTRVGGMANSIYLDLMPKFMGTRKNKPYMIEGTHYTKGWFGSIKAVEVPSGLKAQELYAKLTPEGQLAFDKEAGINAYANPEIGEAYTMATGYDMPGFKKEKGKNVWNFHWGGVIMKDGPDNVTLENYAVIKKGIKRFINREWNFAMYGTMKSSGGVDDTFHGEHLGSGTHGSHATTMSVRTDT